MRAGRNRRLTLATAPKWRLIDRALAQFRGDCAQSLVVEAGAHAPHEPQHARRLVLPGQQRTEMGARAGRLGPSADHEPLDMRTLYLEPSAAAASLVGRAQALGDHALQPEFGDRVVKCTPVARVIVRVTQQAFVPDHPPQQLLAGFEIQAAKIETIEGQQVEHEVRGRATESHRRYLAAIVRLDAPLQGLKARPPVGTERDNLAVEHEAHEGQLAERQHHLGIVGGRLDTAAAEDPHRAAVADRERAHAVVFDFV